MSQSSSSQHSSCIPSTLKPGIGGRSVNDGDSNKGEESPGFTRPGSSASEPGGVQSHDSKVLNKLDPRFDADRLHEQQEGRLKEGNSASE